MCKNLKIFFTVCSFMFCVASADTLSDKIKISEKAKAADEAIIKKYETIKPMGMSVSIDIYGCDLKMMKDEKVVRQFIKDLVKFIDMKTYGEPLLKDFGPTPELTGISALQLIETSNISIHLLPHSKDLGVYIDIFSCKAFPPNAAAEFCKQYFKASKLTISPVNIRY
jgi:S-adenosylmethionine/arginine decarboxylase-like enzyme